jgi:DNA-binding GntR family transcriptional regulator
VSSVLLEVTRPIAHESMSQRVYRDLRELLIAGQLQPGERLTLDSVARALGTSHMPVREAIRQLAAERVLEMLPNRVVRVPVMTRSRFRQLLGMRIMLEGHAVELAAAAISPAALALARGLCDAFCTEIRLDSPDASELIRTNKALHFAVYQACGNQVLLELIESLWLQVGPVLNLDLRSGSRRVSEGPAAACHQRMVDALGRRDPAAARQALEDDLNSAAEVILSGHGLAQA